MAFNRAPSARLFCEAVLRQLEIYETGEKSSYGAGRQAGRAQVLTNDGGFLEIYIAPDKLAAVRQYAPGSDLRWRVDVDVFTQTSARGSRWSTLSASLVEDLDMPDSRTYASAGHSSASSE